MATSGTIYGTTNNSNISVEINWTLEQSISGNYTKVTATLRYFRTDTGYTTYGTGIFGVVINGVDYGVSKYASIDHSGVDVVSNTVTVSHNSDGTHSPITISGYGSISGTSLSSTSISGSVSLPTIPRATTPVLSPSSTDMGSSITIDLTGAASTDFTHDLTYKLPNGTTGTIATGLGKTTKSWIVPDFASSIPNAAACTVTITCVTRSGSTTIGTKAVYLTANVPASVVPTVSSVATSEATDGIAAQFKAYIQSKSKLAVSITAAGAEGSTITGYSTTLQGKAYTGASFTSDVLTVSGSINLVTTVTDSRGRTAKLTTTITVLAYTPPQISAFLAYRVDASGTADDSGDYVAVAYAYTVPSLNGGNTASMTVKYKRSIDTDYNDTLLSGTALTADETDKPTTAISSDYRWDLKITVTDYFGTASSAAVQLPSGQVIVDISADGLGLGIGKTAEGPGLDCAMDAHFRGSANLDIALPVAQGGTGAKTSADARTNLELGSLATLSNAPVANGGTGASNATGARANLGAAAAAWTSIGSKTGTAAITGTFTNYHELLVVLTIPQSAGTRKCSVLIPVAELISGDVEWGTSENSWVSTGYTSGIYAAFYTSQASISLREAYGYGTALTSTTTIHVYGR